MIPPIKPFKTDETLMKFMEDGFPNNSQEHRSKCLNVCQHILNCCQNEDDKPFFRYIISGDEMLIHYNDTERKHQRLNGNVYNFQ